MSGVAGRRVGVRRRPHVCVSRRAATNHQQLLRAWRGTPRPTWHDSPATHTPEAGDDVTAHDHTRHILLTQRAQLLAQHGGGADRDTADAGDAARRGARLLQQQRGERRHAATQRVACVQWQRRHMSIVCMCMCMLMLMCMCMRTHACCRMRRLETRPRGPNTHDCPPQRTCNDERPARAALGRRCQRVDRVGHHIGSSRQQALVHPARHTLRWQRWAGLHVWAAGAASQATCCTTTHTQAHTHSNTQQHTATHSNTHTRARARARARAPPVACAPRLGMPQSTTHNQACTRTWNSNGRGAAVMSVSRSPSSRLPRTHSTMQRRLLSTAT
jgi:hypothetical protein